MTAPAPDRLPRRRLAVVAGLCLGLAWLFAPRHDAAREPSGDPRPASRADTTAGASRGPARVAPDLPAAPSASVHVVLAAEPSPTPEEIAGHGALSEDVTTVQPWQDEPTFEDATTLVIVDPRGVPVPEALVFVLKDGRGSGRSAPLDWRAARPAHALDAPRVSAARAIAGGIHSLTGGDDDFMLDAPLVADAGGRIELRLRAGVPSASADIIAVDPASQVGERDAPYGRAARASVRLQPVRGEARVTVRPLGAVLAREEEPPPAVDAPPDPDALIVMAGDGCSLTLCEAGELHLDPGAPAPSAPPGASGSARDGACSFEGIPAGAYILRRFGIRAREDTQGFDPTPVEVREGALTEVLCERKPRYPLRVRLRDAATPEPICLSAAREVATTTWRRGSEDDPLRFDLPPGAHVIVVKILSDDEDGAADLLFEAPVEVPRDAEIALALRARGALRIARAPRRPDGPGDAAMRRVLARLTSSEDGRLTAWVLGRGDAAIVKASVPAGRYALRWEGRAPDAATIDVPEGGEVDLAEPPPLGGGAPGGR